MDEFNWQLEEENYLRFLRDESGKLARRFKTGYIIYQRRQRLFKFPAVVLGSVSGVASFGTNTFPLQIQPYVSIVVGAISVFIAILNSIESALKISENVQGCLVSHQSFQKLHDDIDREMALPNNDRCTSGITFLRDAYTRYQQILAHAPILDITFSAASTHMISLANSLSLSQVSSLGNLGNES
jgi:hypothetical protein